MAKAVGTGPSRELTLGRGLNCEDGRGGQSRQEMAGGQGPDLEPARRPAWWE